MISQEALYLVLGNAMMDNAPYFVPDCLKDYSLNFGPEYKEKDVEEYCNGVVHSITNKTITKYHRVIEESSLCNVWMKGMCIKLGRLAQGYWDTKGTDTVKFMTLEEIKAIPGNRIITYARIIIDYRTQKQDPNRVQILGHAE